MGCVTEHDIRELIEVDSDLNLDPFLRMASVLADRVNTNDTDNKLSDDELQQIELNLAAHFVTMREQQYQSRSTDQASAAFQGTTGMKLNSSMYGQSAQLLDCTGYLESLANQRRVKAGSMFFGHRDPDSYPEVPENDR